MHEESSAGRVSLSVRRPIERFLHVEAAGGIALIVAAAVALIWANSPLGSSYSGLWQTPITVGVGDWRFEHDLHFLINELLMTVFFLVVGLEIKREIVEGALSDIKSATLPIAAAIGGMLIPALIYLSLNPSGSARQGWGVPMATDIAFAVGVLTLLGNRIHPALRVLLLAVAIIDDIGAILVIALFYSSDFAADGIIVVVIGALSLLLFRKAGVRSGLATVIPLTIIWAGLLQAGVHPTISGVIVGLAAPVRSRFGQRDFLKEAGSALEEYRTRASVAVNQKELIAPLRRLDLAGREAMAPALRTEAALHPWVAFGIMPLFALANAGVKVGDIQLGDPGSGAIMAGVGVGLVVGKPLGIMALSWLSIRLGLCHLPRGVNWTGMLVVGSVAGIGFTMAIFIGELAFVSEGMLGVAKLGVLSASTVAAFGGLFAGRLLLPHLEVPAVTVTASEIEASVEYWTGEAPTPKTSQ